MFFHHVVIPIHSPFVDSSVKKVTESRALEVRFVPLTVHGPLKCPSASKLNATSLMPLNMVKKIVLERSLAKLVISNVILVSIFLDLSSERARQTEHGPVSPSTVPRHHVDCCPNRDMVV